MKKTIVDTETTGIDPNRDEIWQIAAYIVDDDDEVIDHFVMSFRPDNINGISQEALDKCRITREYLLSLPLSSFEAFCKFKEFLEKHVNPFNSKDKLQFIAYNSPFDNAFLRAFWKQHDDEYFGSYFWNPDLCLMRELAFLIRNERHKLHSFRLGSVCKFLDIDFDEAQAHDALYDVQKTYELYRKLI